MKKTLTRSKTFDGDLFKVEKRLTVCNHKCISNELFDIYLSSVKLRFLHLLIQLNLIINVIQNN